MCESVNVWCVIIKLDLFRQCLTKGAIGEWRGGSEGEPDSGTMLTPGTPEEGGGASMGSVYPVTSQTHT